MERAIIFGATGLVGRELVRLLCQSAQWIQVLCLGRQDPGLQDPKIVFATWPHGLHCDEWQQRFQHAHAFCALGTTIKKAKTRAAFRRVDFDLCLQAAQLAHQFQAKSFHLVSSHGAKAQSLNFYLQTKGLLEEQLQNLPLPSLHIYRPSLLLGQRYENRLGERMMQLLTPLYGPLLQGPLADLHPVAASQLADYMLQQSLDPRPGQFFHSSRQINRVENSSHKTS